MSNIITFVVILHLHTQNGHKVLLVQNRTKLKWNRSYLIYVQSVNVSTVHYNTVQKNN